MKFSDKQAFGDLKETSLAERLQNVPQAPGVYQWKDAQGNLLYVGKSRNLRERMRSYFGSPRSLSAKTQRLASQITDFEIIVTQNELEALLLEMNLIKAHRPKYNILLKDDKSYPYIKVTLQEEWPRIFPTRKVTDDGSRYFGPYSDAQSVRTTLKFLNRLFAFRPSYGCAEAKFTRHRRLGKPCLSYDLHHCLGPCVPDLVSVADYQQAIKAVCHFLEGKSDQIIRDLRMKMEKAAEELRFEQAAYLRNQIQNIEKVQEKQQVLRIAQTDQDVIAFAREEGSAVVQILFVRGGKLIGSEPFILQGTEDEPDEALLTSFLTQFYADVPEIPKHLLLASHVEEPMLIERWLAQKHGHKVELHVPQRGEKRQLMQLAFQNAQQKLREVRFQWINSNQRATLGLSELQKFLNLTELPQRIECYDVSHTQGQQTVASMVVFIQGKSKPSAYRRFKLKATTGSDDIAALQEVLFRRFRRATKEESAKDWESLPDLILIDGGLGQVKGVQATLYEAGFAQIPLVGVAKGPKRDRFDLVLADQPGPQVLARDSQIFQLVRQIDEEAHRFALAYHRKLRGKAALGSPLDAIRGLGPKRKRALLKAFGSLEGVRQASLTELAALPGMTLAVAQEIKAAL